MRIRFAAVCALVVWAVACSGRSTVLTPVGSIEVEPAPLPPDPDIAEISGSIPRGMGLAITSGSGDSDEDTAETDGSSAERPDPVSASTSPPGTQEAVATGVSPASLDRMVELLAAELDKTRAFVLELLREARPLPERAEPGPQPAPVGGVEEGTARPSGVDHADPVEAAPSTIAEPTAESETLREFMQRDKGDWSPDQEQAAVARARAMFGDDLKTFSGSRRDGWIATCHYLPTCATAVFARDASREGDWDAAAGELYTRLVGTIGHEGAETIKGWIRGNE